MSERVDYQKKSRLDNNSDNPSDSAVIQLEMVHSELDKLIEKENEEIIQVEQKYKRLKQQLYEKRGGIVENIPEFWYNIFTSHPDICNLLTEEDEDCLLYLSKLEVETSDNVKAGYSIKLYFNENPYFKNDVLIKEFTLKQGNFCSTSTKIDWKKPYPSKENTKSGNRKRSHHKQQHFFDWFSNNEDPSNDIIAEIIKDDVWPNSLQYFLVPDPDMEGDKDDDTSDSSDMDDDSGDNINKGNNKQKDADQGSSSK